MHRFLLMLLMLVILGSVAMAAESARGPVKITSDEYNRVLLNGEPWFPIFFTPGPPPLGAKDPLGRDALDVLVGGGVDGFRIGRGMDTPEEIKKCDEYMEWFAKHGAYAMPYISEPSVFDPKYPQRKEQLRKIIERYKDNPTLAIWKTMDEPAWGGTPAEYMVEAYKYGKTLDQNHPFWIGHAPRSTLENLRTYYDACDMAGLDIYPVSIPMGKHGHFPNKEISVVGDYAQWLDKALYGRKPFFMILQVCWSGCTPPNNILVMPTLEQERYMTYQAIINGSRGLIYFGMPVALQGRDAELGYNWTFWNQVLKPVLSEIRKGSELYPALLAPDSKIPLKATGTPELEFTSREVGPFLYILAAKREGSQKEISFSSDALKGDIQVLFENRIVHAQDGRFTDTFKPFGVHVYRVRIR